jgi:hypothetical protein
VTGISFGSEEALVKAKDGLAELCDIMENALKLADTAGARVVRVIVRIFAHELDVSAQVKNLQTQCSTAELATERLLRAGDVLINNFNEFPEAMRFLGLSSESDLRDYVSKELTIRETLSLQELTREAQERQQHLEGVSSQLRRLQESLGQLREVLEGDDNEG